MYRQQVFQTIQTALHRPYGHAWKHQAEQDPKATQRVEHFFEATPFEVFAKACSPYMRVSIAEKHVRTVPIAKPD